NLSLGQMVNPWSMKLPSLMLPCLETPQTLQWRPPSLKGLLFTRGTMMSRVCTIISLRNRCSSFNSRCSKLFHHSS
ncbi:UNVERIFIED_CONTAM: hypothetical protein HDU68_004884, partial [Siphonaria sp. JEL0065]